MYEKIKSWLDSEEKDFDEGLTLFQQVSKNRSVFLYLFRKKQLPKLEYELQKIASFMETQQVAEKAKIVPIAGNIVPPPDPGMDPVQVLSERKINPENLTPELKEVFDSIVEKYKIARALHEKMKLPELTDAQRAEVRAELVKFDDEIAAGWKILDAPKAEGDDKSSKELDPAEISKKINAARKYMSDNLPKLSTLKGAPLNKVKEGLANRYQTLVDLKAGISQETTDAMKAAGIIS